MATSTAQIPISEHISESTFRNYSSEQAQAYAESRPTYVPALITHIINTHQSTGGSLNRVLDLGCGPGNATRDLATYFNHAIGLDPSASMIATASSIGGKAKESLIEYRVGEAETCEGIPDGSVDLIAAGTSAHWFDMQRFWPTAARILAPGGSVALFVVIHRSVHPSTPRKEEIEKIIYQLGHVTLQPYKNKGNEVARDNYATLGLPWDISPPVEAFEKARFVRKLWNEDGKPEEDGSYLSGVMKVKVSGVEKRYGTSSAVTRYRQENPDVANTEKDVVKQAFREIKGLFKEGEEKVISFTGTTTLLLLKRR